MELLTDALLATLTVYLSFRCMLAPKLSKTVFTFFAFGLILALMWIRLGAVDVAIAEAAIASGFMGVLLLDSLRDFSPANSEFEDNTEQPPNQVAFAKRSLKQWIPAIVSGTGLLLFLLIALQAVREVPAGGGLAAFAEAKLPESGAEHPVTAVLLNFRAYDTLLEVAVILMGLLAIFAAGGIRQFRKPSLPPAQDPVLRKAILIFTPLLFLFGAFLLYIGKSGPGGAFQAAVLWGAIGILLHLGGWRIFNALSRRMRRIIIIVGPLFFLLTGFALMARSGTFLAYPPAFAGFLILIIETLAAVSIAAALTAIYAFLTD